MLYLYPFFIYMLTEFSKNIIKNQTFFILDYGILLFFLMATVSKSYSLTKH